jgi:ribosomal protein S18 acetylase RimI-like enzyme
MTDNLIIREMKPSETYLLKDFLYEAIFQKDETQKLPREIINEPHLKIYIDEFGRPGDFCLVADINGRLAGAVWTRQFPEGQKGYGHVDDSTPELSISLRKEYRNQGIGTALMKAMLKLLKEQGFEKVSLSVQKDNYASKMYRNLGFEVVKDEPEEYLMIYQLI